MIDAERYLAVGALLFVLGAIGFLTRRNLILMILSAELMLHGVSLTLVTFSRMHNNVQGQVFTIFILAVAACEAGLALALILALYKKLKSLDVELWTYLREPDVSPPKSDDSRVAKLMEQEEVIPMPKLTPAGLEPAVESFAIPIKPTPSKRRPETEEEYSLPSANR